MAELAPASEYHALDGAGAAGFLATVESTLEAPHEQPALRGIQAAV